VAKTKEDPVVPDAIIDPDPTPDPVEGEGAEDLREELGRDSLVQSAMDFHGCSEEHAQAMIERALNHLILEEVKRRGAYE
jgi:hypothetical protein